MKRIVISLIVSLLALAPFCSAGANQVIIGYCNGMIADESQGTITGLSGNNVRIHAAIRLTEEQLKAYRDGQITHLRYGFPAGVTLPSALTVWVRTSQSGDNLQELTIAPTGGWNDVELPAPLPLESYEELWIGMSFLQSRKMNVLSLAGEAHPEGCYVAKGNAWRSLAEAQEGSLAIEAVAEGDSFLSHDLALAEVSVASAYCLHGEELSVTGKVVNRAMTPAQAVIHWELCGSEGDFPIDQLLDYRAMSPFEIRIPTASLPEGETSLQLELRWADGTTDQNPADNWWSTPVDISSELAVRRMVCEEGTGLWCGWCVRGIVGLNYMAETYPDRFIGIAVHNNDEFELEAYSRWVAKAMNSGYPGSVVNRQTPCNPRAEQLEELFNAMPAYSPYDVAVTAEFPDQTERDAQQSNVVVTAKVTSLARVAEHDLRIAIVITEDSLYGVQNNEYAGGKEEMGGFESLPNPVYCPLPHVARTISPSIEGDSEALPATLEKGVEYEYTRTVALPRIQYNGQSIRFADTHHLTAIMLLIDGRNGEIVNAAKTDNVIGAGDSAITTLRPDAAQKPRFYSFQGYRISGTRGGFMISENGKIVVFK